MLEQSRTPRSRLAQQSRMPVDKQSNGKPITPALSSNFRSIKSPVTPRLAGSAPNSPASGIRRDPPTRTRSPARENATNVALNGNITPRTVARKTRIDTDSPGTPGNTTDGVATRPRAISGARPRVSPAQAGLGISSPQGAGQGTQPRSNTSPQLYTIHRRASAGKSTGREDDTKFFRADDARPHTESSLNKVQKPPGNENSPAFFVGSPQSELLDSSKASPIRALTDDKFFHVNDAKARVPTASRPNLRTKTSFISATSTQSQPVGRSKGLAARPQSPSKPQAVSTPNNSPRKENTLPPRSPNQSRQPVDRRGSIGSSLSSVRNNQNGHRKSMSMNSLVTSPAAKTTSPILTAVNMLEQRSAGSQEAQSRKSDPPTPQKMPLAHLTNQSTSTESIFVELSSQEDADMRANRTGSISSSVKSPETSSTNLPQQTISQNQHEDAATARRERKVLDLEISNSSLLAINKTLEKELRKQNSELRRFRRLSRSGRLSLAPTHRSISGSTLETVAEGEDELLEISEDDEESDIDALDDEDVLSNDSSSVQSPTSKSRQRARDERRLMLDLSKHQQMLVDSQKLTQSIRRCLTCTEELIRDGNKALQYKVGIGDVKLGGRVLNQDEVEEQHSGDDSGAGPIRRQGLLSPSLATANLNGANPWFQEGGSEQQLDGVLDPDLASPTALQDCLDLLAVSKT